MTKDKIIPIVVYLSFLVVFTALLIVTLTSCSLKICECNSPKCTKKSVDGNNSRLDEFELKIPSGS